MFYLVLFFFMISGNKRKSVILLRRLFYDLTSLDVIHWCVLCKIPNTNCFQFWNCFTASYHFSGYKNHNQKHNTYTSPLSITLYWYCLYLLPQYMHTTHSTIRLLDMSFHNNSSSPQQIHHTTQTHHHSNKAASCQGCCPNWSPLLTSPIAHYNKTTRI